MYARDNNIITTTNFTNKFACNLKNFKRKSGYVICFPLCTRIALHYLPFNQTLSHYQYAINKIRSQLKLSSFALFLRTYKTYANGAFISDVVIDGIKYFPGTSIGWSARPYIHNPESELIKFDDNLFPKEFIEHFIKSAARCSPGRRFAPRRVWGWMLLTYKSRAFFCRLFSLLFFNSTPTVINKFGSLFNWLFPPFFMYFVTNSYTRGFRLFFTSSIFW